MKVKIIAHPNSKNPRIHVIDGILHVYVQSVARDGQANEDVVRSLSKHYSVPKSCVKLLRGAKSKQKLFAIEK